MHHDRGGRGSEINPFLSESAWPLPVVAATYEEDRHNFSSSKRIAKNLYTRVYHYDTFLVYNAMLKLY